METTIEKLGIYIMGLYKDSGTEHGKYYSIIGSFSWGGPRTRSSGASGMGSRYHLLSRCSARHCSEAS